MFNYSPTLLKLKYKYKVSLIFKLFLKICVYLRSISYLIYQLPEVHNKVSLLNPASGLNISPILFINVHVHIFFTVSDEKVKNFDIFENISFKGKEKLRTITLTQSKALRGKQNFILACHKYLIRVLYIIQRCV